MKKKRINKELLFVLTSGVVCFSFMTFILMVFPAVRLPEYKVQGIEAIFGGATEEGLKFKFNLLSFVGYLLPFIVIIISIIGFKTQKILFDIITMILIVISGVLIALQPTIFISVNELSDVAVGYLIGPILGIVFSVISMIFSISCLRTKLNK